jgi:hypothetical protein
MSEHKTPVLEVKDIVNVSVVWWQSTRFRWRFAPGESGWTFRRQWSRKIDFDQGGIRRLSSG